MTKIDMEVLFDEIAPYASKDPDLAEAEKCTRNYALRNAVRALSHEETVRHFLLAIKIGRELERAEADNEIDQLQETVMKLTEAKPGMVWVKHDGSAKCPVDCDAKVLVNHKSGFPQVGFRAEERQWESVTHYCEITQPEEK
jgi:hypothetical protein